MEWGVPWGVDWGKEGATLAPCLWGFTWGNTDQSWGCAPSIQNVIIQGSHKVCVRFRFPITGDATYDFPESWTITGDGARSPRVAKVTRGLRPTIITLDLDRTLRPGIEYTFSVNPAGTGSGIRTSLEPLASPAGILTSFDVAIKDGGDFQPTKAGAYKLIGGIESVTQIIWTKVLTQKGELFWAPDEGAGFPLKQLAEADLTIPTKRIRDAVLSVPYVDAAEVVLTFQSVDQNLRIDIDAQTSVGRIRTSRAVTLSEAA